VVAVALRHPEYHELLGRPDDYQDRDYLPELGETNPFLHMGMHIAVEEQLSLDRPPGVRQTYQRILAGAGDEHTAQHQAMECLAEAMWTAQRGDTDSFEDDYLACLSRLAAPTSAPGS